MRAWLGLLMVSTALAGCIGDSGEDDLGSAAVPPGGDDALHSVAELLPFETVAVDGTALRGHVYLPDGEGPFATILEFSPYWNTAYGHSEEMTAEEDGRTTLQDWLGKFLDAGFAVALVNIRGTGESDGCKAWMDSAVDGADAYTVIQAISKEEWSNGNVGMVGVSWPGYTQFASLYASPPALKAIAPSSGVIDAYTLFTRRGPPIISQFGPMATTYGVFTAYTAVGAYGDTGPDHVVCPAYAEQIVAFNGLNVDGDKTPFFAARDNRPLIENTTIPMFVTNGLTSGEGHILQFEGLWDIVPPGSRMLLGQWGHGFPSGDKEEAYDEEVVAFFDHHLRGAPLALEPDVVEYQDDEDAWHLSDRWPPASTPVTLYVSDGALVASRDDVAASEQAFVAHNLDALPDDCPGVQALYVSPPLAEDVMLAGNFRTNLTVTSTLPNSNFGVFLYHVPEVAPCTDGRRDAVQQYVDQLVPTWPGEVRRALSDLRHRGYLEQGEDFPVGSPDVMAMTSHPFASVLHAGDRLVLAISGGSIELATRPNAPLLTVSTGPNVEGWITVPVVSGTLRFEEASGDVVPALPLPVAKPTA